MIIKLLHPTIGLCAQEVVRGALTESKIKGIWKKKYGLQYARCTVELERDFTEKRVLHIPSSKTYVNIHTASRATGVPYETIKNHVNKGIGLEYEFEYIKPIL